MKQLKNWLWEDEVSADQLFSSQQVLRRASSNALLGPTDWQAVGFLWAVEKKLKHLKHTLGSYFFFMYSTNQEKKGARKNFRLLSTPSLVFHFVQKREETKEPSSAKSPTRSNIVVFC